MAVDESLTARLRGAPSRRKGVEEKKMFGCVCPFGNRMRFNEDLKADKTRGANS